MTDLIERLSKATEGSRDLDTLVWEVARPEDAGSLLLRAPAYTTSIDSALTLVPDGSYAKLQFGRDHKKAWAWVEMAETESVARSTPALALCIAALKARESRS